MANHDDVLLNDIGGTGFFTLMADTLSGRRKRSGSKPAAAPAATQVVAAAPADDRANAVVRAKSALWMAAGYVGAAAFVVSVTKVINAVDHPLQAAVYAIAGALVAAIAWRNAWRVLMNGSGPSVLDTPPYAVNAIPAPADNVVSMAPALSERCAGVLR